MPHHEAGNGAPGLPRTVHESAKPPPESQERQPLLSVWDVLEREVRLRALKTPQISSEEYDRELEEVYQLEEEVLEKGTSREKLILDLSTAIRYEPAALPLAAYHRDLSLQEFQQFRSQAESLSEAEIREALRKQRGENDRKRKEFFKGRRIFPGSNSAVHV
jgi:hypothetical protein